MPLTQATDFTCSYGTGTSTFNFDPSTTETVGISSQAHQDEAGRTITYVTYNLHLRSIIYVTPTQRLLGTTKNDTELDSIRNILNSPGGQLRYSNRGFGEFAINTGERQRDVKWGPKPKTLVWKPWGDGNACEVEWVVEVSIPQCDAAKFEDAIMEYNFKITDTIDADGITSRSIRGHLIIPQTRDAQANRRFRHSADEYRDLVRPQTPVGFRPGIKTFDLSLDKCRLDFSFTDEEMGAAPPPGVLRVDASMTAHNQDPGAFLAQVYTINANYDLPASVPAFIAKRHFLQLVLTRQESINRGIGEQKAKLPPDSKNQSSMLPLHWRATEPAMYGKIKKCGFSLTFAVTFLVNELMMTYGFWEPVPNSDWQKWKTSLENIIFDVRGQAELVFKPKDEVIIDLCQQPKTSRLRTPNMKPVTGASRPWPGFLGFDSSLKSNSGESSLKSNAGEDKLDENVLKTGEPESPTNYNRYGWISWEQDFKLTRIDSPIIHKTLSEKGPGESIIGSRCRPTYMLVHSGTAIRMGAPIAHPVVDRIGTFLLEPANQPNDGFWMKTIPGAFQRIYLARWQFRYLIKTEYGINGPVFNPLFNEGDVPLTFDNTTRLKLGGVAPNGGGKLRRF